MLSVAIFAENVARGLDIASQNPYSPLMVEGKVLKGERRAAGLLMRDIAREIGVSRQTLWAVERAAEVKPAYVESYRAAVARLRGA